MYFTCLGDENANIPWLEILATSLSFGIILAMGFSSTTDEKSLKDKEVE